MNPYNMREQRDFFMFLATLLSTLFLSACPSSLILYYSPNCSHSRKVLDSLDQMNASIDMKDVTNDAQAKAELKKGGRMEVPALFIDGTALYNDEPIIRWLQSHKECLKPPAM